MEERKMESVQQVSPKLFGDGATKNTHFTKL
jgi:hypothetical protein